MEHGCRNFHYRSNLAKSCKLRELTLKFHRENYERKEGGKNRISQVLKVGRRGKGKRRKRRRKKEKERGKGKKRKGGSEACGRERDSTEAWNEVESIGWGPSFSSSLHRLGIGGGRRRPITDDSHCLRYILSNGVPKLGAPLRSTRQSLSSEKKGEKSNSKVSLSLSLFLSSTVSFLRLTITLPPSISFPPPSLISVPLSRSSRVSTKKAASELFDIVE